MKKIAPLTLVLLLIICTTSIAQNTVTFSQEEVFTIVEKLPEYPGGEKELFKYLKKNCRYPEDAKKQKIEGRVYIKFITDKEGAIQNITIARGLYPSLDQEAIRLISVMPKWKPAMQRDKPVNVWFTLPIAFKLK